MKNNENSWPLRSTAATLIAAMLEACGGGGGGGNSAPAQIGNSLPPTSGPGDVEQFFPDAVGSSWTLFTTAADPIGSTPTYRHSRVDVTGTTTVGGRTASVFRDTSSGTFESHFVNSGGGLAYAGSNELSDPISTAVTPYLMALYPVTPGVAAHIDKRGLDIGEDLDGDGVRETFDLVLHTTVDTFEPATIGIGTFARTARATEALNVSVRSSRFGSTVSFASSVTRWSAPGIGVIRTIQTDAIDGITSTGQAEAVGYRIGGVAHGLSLPYRLADNLAPADSNYATPGAPALASDGTRFLGAAAGTAGMPTVLFDEAGTPLARITLAAGRVPVAAFDGTRYWMVSLADTSTSGTSICQLQRVSTAGVLLDGPAATGGLAIHSAGTQQPYSPHVAYTGQEFVVTWGSLGYAVTGSPGVQAARVSSAGTLPSGAGRAIPVSGPPPQSTASQYVYPRMVSGSGRAVIVWLDNAEQSGAGKGWGGASLHPF